MLLNLVRSVKQERKEEMMRKLAVALSLVSVLGAGVVQALGLGEASVESTLNQPLKAEIELVNIRDLEDNEILPGLASREEFLKAGVERIYFLSDVRFEVQRNENGKMVVQLTTAKPVREPFLNFLVEVIWPSGRLLREYALLIDPPIYGEEPLAPVQQVQSAPALTTNQLPEIDVSDERPARQNVSAPVAQSSGDIYGPTNNSDTMWAIALKVRPDSSVTAQQTMLAIQDMNPDSFINGNINSLKKGQILRLPNLNDIRQRSKRDAVRGVIAQNRDFEKRALGKNVVDATPQSETPVTTPSAVNSGDELKLVVAENTATDNQSGAHAGEAANNGSEDALKNNLAVMLEKLDQASLEKRELNSRVEDLEEQLETLQRLLTLKDDQLANLQTQMGKDEAIDSVKTVDEVMVAEDMAAKGELSSEEESAGTNVDAEKIAEASVAEGMAGSAEPETIVGIEPQAVSADKPVDAPETPKTKPASLPVTEPVEKELTVQSIVETVMKNPMYQLAVGGGVILLLLIVWGLSRRNAQKEQEFFETRNEDGEEPGDIFGAEDVLGSEESNGAVTEVDEAVEAVEETVLPGQAETEDVIAEADIYIAYGRLDQASQLLENAISSEPQRTDIRLKLLEVYAESNEAESFNKQFNEVEALNDDYAMEQALEIKSRFADADADDMMSIDDLENQLLSTEEGPDSEPLEIEGLGAEEAEDKEAEISAIDYEPTQSASEQLDDTADIDEELSSLESDLAADGVGQSDLESEDDDLDIDFDINEIDLDADDTSIEESAPIEFELDSTNVDKQEGEDTLLAGEEVDLGLDIADEISLTSTEEVDVDELELDVDELELDVDNLELDADDLELDVEGLGLDDELSVVDQDVQGSELSDLDTQLADLDSELDDIALDLEPAGDEVKSTDLESPEGDLEDGLSLDDLDLELDKIDSDLDVSFDLEGEGETKQEDGKLMSSDSAVEELEDIAETLSVDSPAPEEVVDSLLEGDLPGLEEDDVVVGAEELGELDLAGDISSDAVSDHSLDADDSLDIDGGTLDLEGSAVDVDGFESGITEDEDFDFLAGTDEAATKLDLARAYIDMGDGDGARDILEEVTLEGSEEQKQEAQDLLKTLD